MVQQMRRDVLSVKHERGRFYEVAGGSVVEIDAVFETAVDLNYFKTAQLNSVGKMLNNVLQCFLI